MRDAARGSQASFRDSVLPEDCIVCLALEFRAQQGGVERDAVGVDPADVQLLEEDVAPLTVEGHELVVGRSSPERRRRESRVSTGRRPLCVAKSLEWCDALPGVRPQEAAAIF